MPIIKKLLSAVKVKPNSTIKDKRFKDQYVGFRYCGPVPKALRVLVQLNTWTNRKRTSNFTLYINTIWRNKDRN